MRCCYVAWLEGVGGTSKGGLGKDGGEVAAHAGSSSSVAWRLGSSVVEVGRGGRVRQLFVRRHQRTDVAAVAVRNSAVAAEWKRRCGNSGLGGNVARERGSTVVHRGVVVRKGCASSGWSLTEAGKGSRGGRNGERSVLSGRSDH